MRVWIGLSLAFLLSLEGCKATLHVAKAIPTTPIVPTASSAPVDALLKPKDSPSPTPNLDSYTGTLLTGKVELDAGYLTQIGAGILSDNGAGIIANNGGGLVSEGGLGLTVQVGAGILTDGGAGILSDNGAGVIANNGAGIIANNGGGIIANNGGGLVSNNGGGLVSKTKYTLMASATDSASPDAAASSVVGLELPAVGLTLAAASLKTGHILNGLIVKTDVQGNYKLKVPANMTENFAIQGRISQTVNGGALDDPRLYYTVIVTPSQASNIAVNEDTALVGRYMRSISRNMIDFLLTSPTLAQDRAKGPQIDDPNLDPATKTLLLGVLQDVATALADAHLTDAQVPLMASRLSDTALSYIDLVNTKVDRTNTAWTDAPDITALAALVQIMQQLREAARQKMVADPTYFDHQDYVIAANASRQTQGLAPLTIRRPSDFCDFVAEVYAGGDGQQFMALGPVLDTLGLGAKLSDGSNAVVTHLSASSKSLGVALGLVLVADPDAKQAFLDAIRGGVPAS